MLPDYAGGSLVNLVASLAAACGAPARHAPAAALPAAALEGARNIVFVIIDGLGDNYLAAKGAGSMLARHRQASLTSVFPSTTASAITTSYTGCTPLEHGLTGWFTLFGEAGCVASPLQFRSRGDMAPLGERGVAPARLFQAAPLLDALRVRAIVVSYRPILDSAYNVSHCGRAERRGYDTLQGFVTETVAAVKSGSERKFVYAYWPEFDAVSHRHGVASSEAAAQFAAVDEAFAQLLAGLAGTDSALVVTADHGFIDSSPEESLSLADGPGLAALLRFPLCGERRVAWCHVQEGREREFAARAADWLGARAEVRPSRALLEEGWLGPGAAHPRIAERVGEVVLLMRDRYTIKDWLPGEPRHLHIGNHGGTHEDEMKIPLIVAAC
jgi:hypothetical protein